jgi:aminopeptidase N
MPSRLRRSATRVAVGLLLVVPATGCTSSSGQESNSGAIDRPASTVPDVGSAGAGDPLFPSLGNGGYHVEHYGLAFDWVPDGNRLAATAVLTAKSTQRLTAFNLDLHGLDVRAVTVDGAPARYTRKGDELTVTPAVEIADGHAFTTTVVYDGVPDPIVDPDGSHEGWMTTHDGAVALGEPAGGPGWFPGNHTPADKAVYDITVTVPDGLVAVSNGRLVEKTAAPEGKTAFHWRADEPMASYLAMLAIGHFDVSEGTIAGVPSYIAIDPQAASPETEAVPEILGNMIPWASDRFGPYPFGATGAVVVDMPDLEYSLETQTRPFFDASPGGETVIHEMAHEWFGDLVTPKTWQDMWLNEGFATYAEWLWAEDHGGPTAAEAAARIYADSPAEGQGMWAFPPADPGSPENVSRAPMYQRAALALQKVRAAVGDEVFFTILRTWLSEHRYGTVTTADFTALCTRLSGQDLGPAVFEPWLFEDAKPDW